MSNLDMARALRDKEYFNSLSDADKARVREEAGVGATSVSDSDLDEVSGGLAGGLRAAETTTTTKGSCECPASLDGCACSCDPDAPAEPGTVG
jgi:hypothetical protein